MTTSVTWQAGDVTNSKHVKNTCRNDKNDKRKKTPWFGDLNTKSKHFASPGRIDPFVLLK